MLGDWSHTSFYSAANPNIDLKSNVHIHSLYQCVKALDTISTGLQEILSRESYKGRLSSALNFAQDWPSIQRENVIPILTLSLPMKYITCT